MRFQLSKTNADSLSLSLSLSLSHPSAAPDGKPLNLLHQLPLRSCFYMRQLQLANHETHFSLGTADPLTGIKQASSSAQIHAMANTLPTRSFRFVTELGIDIDLTQSSHHPPLPPPPLLSSPLTHLCSSKRRIHKNQNRNKNRNNTTPIPLTLLFFPYLPSGDLVQAFS